MNRLVNKLKVMWYVLRGRGVIYRVDFLKGGVNYRAHVDGKTITPLVTECTFQAMTDKEWANEIDFLRRGVWHGKVGVDEATN